MGTRCSEICEISIDFETIAIKFFFKVPKAFMATIVCTVVSVRLLTTYAIMCLAVFANTVYIQKSCFHFMY